MFKYGQKIKIVNPEKEDCLECEVSWRDEMNDYIGEHIILSVDNFDINRQILRIDWKFCRHWLELTKKLTVKEINKQYLDKMLNDDLVEGVPEYNGDLVETFDEYEEDW